MVQGGQGGAMGVAADGCLRLALQERRQGVQPEPRAAPAQERAPGHHFCYFGIKHFSFVYRSRRGSEAEPRNTRNRRCDTQWEHGPPPYGGSYGCWICGSCVGYPLVIVSSRFSKT